jgi:hypothetical protein
VSCTSATSCFAVGYYATTSTVNTLAARWDGTTWSTLAIPNPAGTDNQLSGVSCTSATSCFAVGSSHVSSGNSPLVEQWNGTNWSIDPSPTVDGGELSGVSCTSPTNCFAVGYYLTGHLQTLVEHWDGTSWSVVPSPNPSPSTDSQLSGVSCTSTTSCFAVGGSFPTSTNATLVERWDGASWSIVSSPNHNNSNGPDSLLNGVSCRSATNCFAVGESASGGTLAQHWDGTTWSIVPSPNPPGGDSRLFDVSCPSATSCFAVGFYAVGTAYKGLVEHWNGTSWSIVASPNPNPIIGRFLLGVSCSSSTSCSAVGYLTYGMYHFTLAERYA